MKVRNLSDDLKSILSLILVFLLSKTVFKKSLHGNTKPTQKSSTFLSSALLTKCNQNNKKTKFIFIR